MHLVAANLTVVAQDDVANALAIGDDLTSNVIGKVAGRLHAGAESL